MCRQFGYTKQAYYKQLTTIGNTSVKEEIIVGLIKKKRELWKRGSGRNLYQSLKKDFADHQLKMGRDQFFTVLRNNHMLIKRRSNKARTTMSYHHFNKHSNLIRDLVPQRAKRGLGIRYYLLMVKRKEPFLLFKFGNRYVFP